MNLEKINYIGEALIGLLSVLGIKKAWDVLIEKLRTNLEKKKLETEVELKKIDASNDVAQQVIDVHKENTETWKQEFLKVQKDKERLERKLHQCQQDRQKEKDRLEKEKDDLQTQLINKNKETD